MQITKIKGYLEEKYVFIVLLILAIMVLATPLFIRQINYNGTLLGDKPYYALRISEQILDKGIQNTDLLYNQPYFFDPYHFVLAYLGFFNIALMSKLLPLLFGIISFIVLYKLLIFFRLNLVKRAIILLIFVLSPIFIYVFTSSDSYSLIVLLTLTGFYLFAAKNKPYLGCFLLSLSSLFGIYSMISSLIVVFLYSKIKKNKMKFFYITLMLSALFLMSHLPYFIKYGLPPSLSMQSYTLLENTLSDLGSVLGYGTFTIILFFIGVFSTWKQKREYIMLYIASFLFIILSLYFYNYNVFLNFIVVFFAALGFFYLLNRKWEVQLIKKATIFIVVLGLLFSAVSYISRMSQNSPDNDMYSALNFLSSKEQGIVLSYSKYSFWIEGISKKPVFIGIYEKKGTEKASIAEEIFSSRNLVRTLALLEDNNIKYILLTDEMKQGKVWKRGDDGLLFLLPNSERFKNIYKSGNTEIWEFN